MARYRFQKLTPLIAALLAGAPQMLAQSMPAALPEDLMPPLKGLLETAVKQSPTTLARGISVAQAQGDAIVDRAAMLPSLSGYAAYTFRETAISTNADAKSKNDGFFYSLSANQPVFYWGALKHQAEIGKLGVKLAEKQYAEAYRTLAISIRAQYLTLIEKKMAARNQRFNVRAAESNLALQEARLRDGRISAGEIVAPRLAVDEARIYAERAEFDFEHTKRALAALVGVSDIPDANIPDDIPRPAYAPETLGAYFETMKSFDPAHTYLGSYYNMLIEQSDRRYKIARVRLLPKFYLSAGYSQENLTTVVNGLPNQTAVTTTNYGITGIWTLFDGLATRGAKLSSLAAKRLAERNLETYKNSTGEQLRLLERQIGFSGRLMSLTETRKELALAAVKKVGDDVRSGVSSQNMLDAVTNTANKAELEALSARSDFLSYWSEYVSLLGVDPILENVSPRHLRNGK